MRSVATLNERARYKTREACVAPRKSAAANAEAVRPDVFADPDTVLLRRFEAPADPLELNPLFREVPRPLLDKDRWRLEFAARFDIDEKI